MDVYGYFAAALIGVSLGLIGGGGSILTVPVLVYLFGLSPLLATSYSLFIVGSTSLLGAVNNYRRGFVNVKVAFLFSLSSISTVFLIRKFLIPLIPKTIITVYGFTITEQLLTMVLFALLMLVSAIGMIRNGELKETIPRPVKQPVFKLLCYGIGIGLTTGLLGAGGGFLIIPTLVLLLGLDMKEAVGTSLLIIALNSLVGFVGDLGHFTINWKFLGAISSIAIAGIFIGGYLAKKFDEERLKKSFGIFVLIMGAGILIKELLAL